MPKGVAAQGPVLRVDGPKQAHVPAEAVTNRFEDLRGVVPKRDRLSEDLGDGEAGIPAMFHPLALGNVAEMGGEDGRPRRGNPRDGQLDGELSPIGTQARHFDAFVEDRAFAGGEIAGEAAAMAVPHRQRDDEFGQFPPQHIRPAVAEGSLSGRVELDDSPLVVDGDNAVEGCFQDGRLAGLAFPQPPLALFGGLARRLFLEQAAGVPFGLPALGHVPRDLGETPQAPGLVPQGGNDHVRPKPGAVFAQPPPLRLVFALRGCHFQRLLGLARFDVFGRIEAGEVLTDDLLGLVAGDPLASGIPRQDMPLGIEHENGVLLRALDQQAKLFGLAFDLFGLLEKLDEAGDFGPQDGGHDRLYEVIDGAQLIRLRHPKAVAVIGREEYDRSVLELLVTTDQFGGLEPVQALHLNVEQDHRKISIEQSSQGLLPGARLDQIEAQLLKDHLERQQIGWLVIHQQDVHRLPGRQFFRGIERLRGFRHIPLLPLNAKKRRESPSYLGTGTETPAIKVSGKGPLPIPDPV